MLIVTGGILFAQQKITEFPKLTSEYFGQTPPHDTAEIFAKDLISVKELK